MKGRPIARRRVGYGIGLLSVVVNLVLFGLKLWAGSRADSVAMIADAWHTLSDILTSLIVVFGFWAAGLPTDKEHPFGHGRAELVGAIVIGTLLGVVGVNFIRESVVQLREAGHASFGLSGVVIFGVSAALKEGLAQLSIRTGRKIDSRSLVADGWHHRSDAVASLVIVAGALLGRRVWWLDGALGLLVSLLILFAAFEVIRDSSRLLLGEAPDRDLVGRIKEILEPILPDMADVHHIHVHRYGDHVEVTMHAYMPDEYSLKQVHDLVDRAEDSLRRGLAIEPTIHVDPATER
jgi:cation diffusion facilitator family transporter